jgi:hypothetical protein
MPISNSNQDQPCDLKGITVNGEPVSSYINEKETEDAADRAKTDPTKVKRTLPKKDKVEYKEHKEKNGKPYTPVGHINRERWEINMNQTQTLPEKILAVLMKGNAVSTKDIISEIKTDKPTSTIGSTLHDFIKSDLGYFLIRDHVRDTVSGRMNNIYKLTKEFVDNVPFNIANLLRMKGKGSLSMDEFAKKFPNIPVPIEKAKIAGKKPQGVGKEMTPETFFFKHRERIMQLVVENISVTELHSVLKNVERKLLSKYMVDKIRQEEMDVFSFLELLTLDEISCLSDKMVDNTNHNQFKRLIADKTTGYILSLLHAIKGPKEIKQWIEENKIVETKSNDLPATSISIRDLGKTLKYLANMGVQVSNDLDYEDD